MTVVPLAAEVSLIHGWLPVVVQAVAAVALLLALSRRSRRWLLVCLPIAIGIGVAAVALVWWYIDHQGWTGEPPPVLLWLWVGLTALAIVVLLLGWLGTRWWQRIITILAIPLALLCALLVLNQWLAYLPTVSAAWDRATGSGLSGATDRAGVAEMQKDGTTPLHGTMVEVTIPDTASGFRHRNELVYLPPAWYASQPPPSLPVVVMIHAEFGHPSDWIVGGDGQKTLDEFATKHGGNAPVVVFVDSSGTFSNDTECVNGPRGNAADHITKDVVPFMVSEFGVSPKASSWGIVGWSSGGTCAVTLTAKYPELFHTFVDVDGQKGPYAGTKEQTIARLFDGNAQAWADFDPRTLMERRGRYDGVAGWFSVSKDTPTVHRAPSAPGSATLPPELDDETNVLDAVATANYMCEIGSAHGMECSVVPNPGAHDFKNAGEAFKDSLPWLAARLGTPDVPQVALPGSGA